GIERAGAPAHDRDRSHAAGEAAPAGLRGVAAQVATELREARQVARESPEVRERLATLTLLEQADGIDGLLGPVRQRRQGASGPAPGPEGGRRALVAQREHGRTLAEAGVVIEEVLRRELPRHDPVVDDRVGLVVDLAGVTVEPRAEIGVLVDEVPRAVRAEDIAEAALANHVPGAQ